MTTNQTKNNILSLKAKLGKHRLPIIILILLSIPAVFLVPLLFGKDDQNVTIEDQTLRVLTVPTTPLVKETSYLRHRYYLGVVEPQRSSSLGFEVAGMIKTIHIREGEFVEKGALLAELDTQRLEAARQESEAQLIEAKATYTLAQATLERTRHAQKLKAVSIQQLDEAISNLDSQQARVARVKAQVNRINVDLAKAKIYAPYAGSIAERRSDEGTVIGAGQTVLELLETAKTEIRIGFDRDVSAELEIGSRFPAKVRNIPLTLEIERILPGRDQSTRVVQVIAVPVSSSVELREDDLVEVSISQQITTPGYWLPVSALTENARGLWSCLVAVPLEDSEKEQQATHRLVRRDVEILALEEDRLFVSANFDGEEQLVVNGVHRVVPQQRVNIHSLSTADFEKIAALDR
ncbi:MAG: efflux RND transporter periplasmic adaptor subunit [Desulfocapsaceae bacterium]|nr:efflux RND transporter periplasmic adaptor subunit [Desulfocapsaceae bacterium]